MFHVKHSVPILPTAYKTSRYEREIVMALRAASKAGSLISNRWNTPLSVQSKGKIDLVTEVDLAAEDLIIDIISHAFPSDQIVAEESRSEADQAGRSWHIDPLDGTTNFTHGFPQFATSIALVVDEVPVLGVVYDPLRDWFFSAVTGAGAHLNGKSLRVSPTVKLGRSLIATGFPYDRWTRKNNNSQVFCDLLRRTQGMRRAGAAALDLAFVAAGWLDGYWEKSLGSWDIAAGICLVCEAGGCVTDYSGVPATISNGSIVASNSLIHDELRSAVTNAVAELEDKSR